MCVATEQMLGDLYVYDRRGHVASIRRMCRPDGGRPRKRRRESSPDELPHFEEYVDDEGRPMTD